jgi:hypothetical protein
MVVCEDTNHGYKNGSEKQNGSGEMRAGNGKRARENKKARIKILAFLFCGG